MISFATLVAKMTGKAPQEPAQPNGGGVAVGGEFAELVRLAAQPGGGVGAGNATNASTAISGDVNGLRLVSDNGKTFTPGPQTFASDAGIELVPPPGTIATRPLTNPAPVLDVAAAHPGHAALLATQTPRQTVTADATPVTPVPEDVFADSDPATEAEGASETDVTPSSAPVAVADLTNPSRMDVVANLDQREPQPPAPQDAAALAQPIPTPVVAAAIPAAPATPLTFVPTEALDARAAPLPIAQALPIARAPSNEQMLPTEQSPSNEQALVSSTEPEVAQQSTALREAVIRSLAATPTGVGAAAITNATDGAPILRPTMTATYTAGFPANAGSTGEGATSDATVDLSKVTSSRSTEGVSRLASPELMTNNSPLRAIVDMLPPVIQAELGTATVRGATGPSTAEALGSQVIDMGVSGQWIDRMAREIAGLANGNGHSRFTLNPPHLGHLQVDIFHGADATDVRLLAETDEATRRLSEGRPALQTDPRMAGLQITVEKASNQSDTPARDQGQTQRDLAGQAQQQQQGDRQAQGRGGQADRDSWAARTARDPSIQRDDADVAAAARGRSTGNVRFA